LHSRDLEGKRAELRCARAAAGVNVVTAGTLAES
jgi:hypothetical protein